ncbi:hypothetical protein GCM10010495_09100 [Kitasatospora herbaricolor]|uniref:DUF3566 domain-containing protein n=1 Tax=Kitasatospora herbaricolor TaxID=68217 RepID=UPI0019B8CAA4|nr:DUF3566 domain-containing protein [Kitasatospora herbaricolor]MDQ0309653.1 hypothetical protein [Kitasatospora herbaricolor]GGV00454.1 hypothetical protein GCM10010495_09100 [Kitasatospora herbaricolor]
MPYGGVPQTPAEHPAASTSLMPPVGSGGQPGAAGGYGTPPPPPAPPAAPAAGGGNGFSQPTTYAKGQPTPARGTRVNAGAPAGGPAGPAAPAAGGAARRPAPAAPAGTGRTRKARLRVTKADPWSVMKVSFLLSLAVGVILIVAAAVLWMTLDSLGVFDSLTKTLKDVTGSDTTGGLNLMDYVGFGKVMSFTVLIAVVDVVLLTALATLSAFIYNTAAGFTGGVELTLAEED